MCKVCEGVQSVGKTAFFTHSLSSLSHCRISPSLLRSRFELIILSLLMSRVPKQGKDTLIFYYTLPAAIINVMQVLRYVC